MEKKIVDKGLGEIILRHSSRAKHYTLKICNGQITAILPLQGDEKKMLQFIEDNRDKLLKALQKHPRKQLFDDRTERQMTTFSLHIFRTERANFYMKLEKGILHIACPQDTDFQSEEAQDILKQLIEKALRHEAKRLLPSRLLSLAKQHGFTCTGVKINNSHTHWGSCNGKKSINLSLQLMTLPWHLIDYVLLHELCHTVEMNHSEKFWMQMDRVTNGKAQALRQELKTNHTL